MAPAARRMAVKVVGSIAARPNAARPSTELAANAIRVNTVNVSV